MGCGVVAAQLPLEQQVLVRPQASQQKRCARCGQDKPLSEFNKHSQRKDGVQVYCRECNRTYGKDWLQRNPERLVRVYDLRDKLRTAARSYIQNYLETHPCVDCAEVDWVVLEFDHVRGVKIKSVSALVGGGAPLAAVKEEIAKCDVRCANCHRRVTYLRSGSYRIVKPQWFSG